MYFEEEKSLKQIADEEKSESPHISYIVRSELKKVRNYKNLYEIPASESHQILEDYKLHYELI